MAGYNFNHFTGKTKRGNTRRNRKKKIRVKKIHRNKYKPQHIAYKRGDHMKEKDLMELLRFLLSDQMGVEYEIHKAGETTKEETA